MSIGRLTFLYPHLLRATATRAAAVAVAVRGKGRANSSFARRAGKAVEPLGWEKKQDADAEPAEKDKEKTDIGKQDFEEKQQDAATTTIPPTTTTTTATIAEESSPPDDPAAGAEKQQQQQQQQQQDENKPKALEAAYLAGAPDSPPIATATATTTSSISTTAITPATTFSTGPPQRYIHHFDSYSLVKQLQEGGYTSDQAVTAMKAIRALLAQNLNLAQETLVSKSDVENEAYLFRAACSELSAEISKNRRVRDEEIRQQRTHLQHEVDRLTQGLSGELLTLNDVVRGLFNDRSMAVREQQKTADSAIQQINYKMSIMLSSDSKSEIEGVRWILIRRSVVGIIFMAILTLGTIRYATYVSHERAKEAERRRKERTHHPLHEGGALAN